MIMLVSYIRHKVFAQMTLAGMQNQQSALLNVDTKKQGTAGAAELDLEPFVGRWRFPRCPG